MIWRRAEFRGWGWVLDRDFAGRRRIAAGARAVALMVLPAERLGAWAGRVSTLFGQLGVPVSPGGVTPDGRAAARRCQATYDALVEQIRGSPAVAADETGWRIAGPEAWLWVFAIPGLTVYRVACRSRVIP